MNPETLLLGRSPDWWTAVATIVNSVTVIILVWINFRYMRSAAKQAHAAADQADAAHDQAAAALEQARAAEKQTAAAMENIELVKKQMRDQEMLKRTEAVIDLRRLRLLLDWWIPKLEGSSGQLPPFERFLPDNWSSIVFILERALPARKQDLIVIETKVSNAENLVKTELKKSANYQYPDVFKAASRDLAEASRPLGELLSALENQKAS
jgi:hypothetical protein